MNVLAWGCADLLPMPQQKYSRRTATFGVMTALDRHISAVNSAVEKVQSLAATQSCAEMCKHLTIWLKGQAQICQWHKDNEQLSTSAPTAL